MLSGDQSSIPLLEVLSTGSSSNQHVVPVRPEQWRRGGQSRRRRRRPSVESFSTSGTEYDNEFLQCVEARNNNEVQDLLDNGTDVNVSDSRSKYTALHIASKNDDGGMINLLFRYKADVNAQDCNLETPLHIAVREQHIMSCRLIIEHSDINVNIKNKADDTPLHVVARKGHVEICEIILSTTNIEIDAQNKLSWTPLHIAAQMNNTVILQLLLSKGANFKLQDRLTYLPIHIAAEEGSYECCQELLDIDKEDVRGKQRLKDGKTALMLAAASGYGNCCKLLNADNIDKKDKNNNTALHYATFGCYEETIEELLHMGADPNVENKTGCTPVLEAASKRNNRSLKALCSKGGNVQAFNLKGKTVLHYAAKKNNEDCMKYLLTLPKVTEIIDKKTKTNFTALNLAIRNKASECAKLLINKGASLTEKSEGNMTPLHLAADKGLLDICTELLRSQEVQVNEHNDKGETPLHLANKEEIYRILIHKGARLKAVDEQGCTALHKAAARGNAEVMKFLLRKGISIRDLDDTGSNALHVAASSKAEEALECCKVLVFQSRDLNQALNMKSLMPLDIAFEHKHDEIFEYLLLKMKVPKGQEFERQEFSCLKLRLHQYMHTSMDSERMVVVRAIVKSEWWEAGFVTSVDAPCTNFLALVKTYPDLLSEVQKRCITYPTEEEVSYNFRFYQYIKSGTCEYSVNHQANSSPDIEHPHPLALMVKHKLMKNLQHQLTTDWFLHKFKYHAARYISLSLLELFYLIFLVVFMASVENWDHIELQCNASRSTLKHILAEHAIFYDADSQISFTSCSGSSVFEFTIWIFLIIIVFCTVMLEFNYLFWLRRDYIQSLSDLTRVCRLICTMFIIVPDEHCQGECLILKTWCWLFGIPAVLLASIHFITTVHGLPISVVMSHTHSFLKSLAFNVIHLMSFALTFAFVFHLLLSNLEAFSTIPEALIKMFVWMLGDLAYDDTFLNGNGPKILYPVAARILFIVFIMIMGGYIANLVVTQYSNKSERLFEKASFNLSAARVMILLRNDKCFFWIRKRKLPREVTGKKIDSIMTHIAKVFLMLDGRDKALFIVPSPNQKELELGNQIDNMMKLQKEQNKQIRELKEKLDTITKTLQSFTQANN